MMDHNEHGEKVSGVNISAIIWTMKLNKKVANQIVLQILRKLLLNYSGNALGSQEMFKTKCSNISKNVKKKFKNIVQNTSSSARTVWKTVTRYYMWAFLLTAKTMRIRPIVLVTDMFYWILVRFLI